MSLWFTASAVSPELQRLWNLSTTQAGWLTTIVQLGFVAGTALAAALNLADVLPARWYVPVAALLAAACNALLLIATTFALALVLRFFTGLFLAGVYPPAMKMIATWFAPTGKGRVTRRGLAIGTLVGALTIGKGMPYLLRAFEGVSYRSVPADRLFDLACDRDARTLWLAGGIRAARHRASAGNRIDGASAVGPQPRLKDFSGARRDQVASFLGRTLGASEASAETTAPRRRRQ